MRQEKLLIVEDDRAIRQLISTQLHCLNLHIDEASSAEAAIKKLASSSYGNSTA